MTNEWRRSKTKRVEEPREEERPRKRRKRGEWRKEADHSWGLNEISTEVLGVKRWMLESYTAKDSTEHDDDDRSQECELRSTRTTGDTQAGVSKARKQIKITDMLSALAGKKNESKPGPSTASVTLEQGPPVAVQFEINVCEHDESSRLLKLTTLGYDQVSISGIVTSPNKPEIENLTSEIGFKILRSDINTIFVAGMVDKIRSLQDMDKEQEAHPIITTIPSKDTMLQFKGSKDHQSLIIVVPGASSQAEEPGKLPVEMLGLQNKHLVEVQVDMLAIEVKFEEREDEMTEKEDRMSKEEVSVVGREDERTEQVDQLAKEEVSVVGKEDEMSEQVDCLPMEEVSEVGAARRPADMTSLAKETMPSKNSQRVTFEGTKQLIMKHEEMNSMRNMPSKVEVKQTKPRKILKGGRGKSKPGGLVQARIEKFMTLSHITQVEQGRPPKRKQVDLGDKQIPGMKFARKK
jgi:hypothetical protein